ncbi:hypothetical protein HYDPIDRAFT_39439 [Hydnomerulius pinastri MD-312]|nr:hypothetical protein HYDPIDRAFT_39439 [Hydnomerulius pinastri MD-312]
MEAISLCEYGDRPHVIRPPTKNHPSPLRMSSTNRHPSQPHTRAEIDNALQCELSKARFIAHDLADHMFGHLVSTAMAKGILLSFMQDGIVSVYEGQWNSTKSPLDAHSLDAKLALGAAFAEARAYGCIRSDSDSDSTSAKTDGHPAMDKNGREKKQYSWRWRDFPATPVKEGQLVAFLNTIVDNARQAAESQLSDSTLTIRNRFASPKDQHHAVPLAYEVDREDMRPDFLVLPINAFSGTALETVDEGYMNFTAMRVVGESKTKDFASGLWQVQRYARGIRRAQPWVHFVVAMTVAQDKAALMRGDGSGTERLELALTEGRGCIEFIRTLLGLALAEGKDLGENPAVVLASEEISCKVSKALPVARPQTRGKYRENPHTVTSSFDLSLGSALPSVEFPERPPSLNSGRTSRSTQPSLPTHASTIATRSSRSSTSKRSYSEVEARGDEGDKTSRPAKKAKVEHVRRIAFFPVLVYGHKCLGIIFTAGSIRGRGTTVFCVVDLTDQSKLLALKTSWQDLEREGQQQAVLTILKANKRCPNIILPLNLEQFLDDKKPTTLETIRAFLGHDRRYRVENRTLNVSISELKRPVKYFWGVHDFVRGLRGALLGLQYLSEIGVLHRDISENNIVLGRLPCEERGYLIDFDMAIPKKFTPDEDTVNDASNDTGSDDDSAGRPSSPLSSHSNQFKAERTGTTPYMSMGVLQGDAHTHYDDVESLLYVLLLFFFSYAGPLPKDDLRAADERGFTHVLGSGLLPHVRRWPDQYASWADGSFLDLAATKSGMLCAKDSHTRLLKQPAFKTCLEQNWDAALHSSIKKLVARCWRMFTMSRLQPQATGTLPATRVTPQQFIGVLDEWLTEFSDDEPKFSHCPFE